MAMAVNKPTSVEFINTVFHDKEKEYNIEEMIINKNANLIGKTMRDSNIKEKFGVTIVAIKRGEEIISNPELNEEFQSEDLLLVFGTSEQLAKFGKVVS
ncbi:MAG: TrkA C-terminal domain-containing protein [Bacillus sp. (in: Bacteria)]|nr:TrkA C-terminal domain-containing protein [Bacillus sp. (in: firmicutes)]